MQSTSSTRPNQSESVSKRETLFQAIAELTPVPSNTGVHSSQGSEKSTENVCSSVAGDDAGPSDAGGCDYLETSHYGGWDRSKFEELARHLDEKKEETQRLRQTHGKGWAVFEAPEGELMLVEPFGIAGGCPCRWVLKIPGQVTISIVDRPEYIEGKPSVRVSIPSAPCMAHGEENILARVNCILRSLGFEEVQPSGLSRVDVCVDLAGVCTDEVTRAFERGERIKLADNAQTFEKGNRKTGFVVGSGDACKMRIYDKELETRHDPEKREIMRERRWGGVVPERATRIEFQLRRRWLSKHFGIKTLADWREKRAEVVAYLTERWFRMTDGVVDADNKNHQRAEVSSIWQRVQKAFAAVFGESCAAFLKPLTRPPKASEPLVVQALGCLSSAIALGVDPDEEPNEPALLRALHEYFAPMLGDLARQVQEKAKAYRVTKTLPPPINFAEIPF